MTDESLFRGLKGLDDSVPLESKRTYTVNGITYDSASGRAIRNTYTVNGITYDSASGRAVDKHGNFLIDSVHSPISPSVSEPSSDSTGGNPPAPALPVTERPVDEERSKTDPVGKQYPLKKRPPIDAKNGILRYPYSALTEETDYLQIDIRDYTPLGKRNEGANRRENKNARDFRGLMRDFNNPNDRGRQITSDPINVSNSATLSKRSLIRKGTIILPMPETVVDGNTVSYADSNMNALTAIGLGVGEDFMTTIGEMVGKGATLESIGKKAIDIGGAAVRDLSASVGGIEGVGDIVTKLLTTQLVGQLGGNVSLQQILARESGTIFNPNKELLFNGVNLRNFNFQYKFIPRNQKESEQVMNIIRTLKQNMAPKVAGAMGTGFLNTPAVFELRYRKGHSDHPFLHKFKQCFLENITVNYTGDGFYTTYWDGNPVSLTMNLTFREIEPIYDIDYENAPNGVGY